ncbi:MAG: nickel pincer cofactor biosynthesis protein LarC [Oscillospiraceae bacterium]|nr:nickel pincer cofactor biosynthesis protein LarC [Oscillospiraceae bacterium]
MKTLYLDCSMGAAGDMLTAALTELLPEPEKFIEKLNSLGIPGVSFIKETSTKCGITGTHMSVLINGTEEGEHSHEHTHTHSHEHTHSHGGGKEHSHHHSSLWDIEHIVRFHLNISEKVKKDIISVYRLIADAESKVHGVPVTEIHFHEVGTMDALADICAVCMLIEELGPDRIIASPVHVGSGSVKCAHGILPVPAPATAEILSGVPIYGGSIKSELCTPTGAALLKHFVSSFGDMPMMLLTKTGYGMGKKDFERANCVRAMLGESDLYKNESVYELSCNIDDMTAEAIGFAMGEILKGGALDVWTVAIGMKKCRPGVMLCVLCREEDRSRMAELIFRHTSTIGIRENSFSRYTLQRRTETMETPFGSVRKKISEGYGIKREKIEYDDLAAIASGEGKSITEIKAIIEGL